MRTLLAVAALLPSVSIAAEPCDVACKIEQGLRGDPTAALEVAEASGHTQTEEIVGNWLRIAAENGSAAGQARYGTWLARNSQSGYDCLRAAFWLDRAAASGNPHAAAASDKLRAYLTAPGKQSELCRDAL